MANHILWLVVEDQADEFFLLQRASSRAFESPPTLHWEHDGLGAKEFLIRAAPAPQLIVSDLKMPIMDGFELFQWLRSHPHLQRRPFVILTNSAHETDRLRAEALGVDGFWVKPSSLADYGRVLTEIATVASRWPGRQ